MPVAPKRQKQASESLIGVIGRSSSLHRRAALRQQEMKRGAEGHLIGEETRQVRPVGSADAIANDGEAKPQRFVQDVKQHCRSRAFQHCELDVVGKWHIRLAPPESGPGVEKRFEVALKSVNGKWGISHLG